MMCSFKFDHSTTLNSELLRLLTPHPHPKKQNGTNKWHEVSVLYPSSFVELIITYSIFHRI